MPHLHWQTSRFELELSRPLVMAIVNLTPDSFSDGKPQQTLSASLAHAETLLSQGADILDIGGESTRPGAQAVPLQEELRRVMPFIEQAVKWQVPLSIDTYKPEVMQAALDLGVDIVNDTQALLQTNAEQVVLRHPRCGLCLMHALTVPLHENPAAHVIEFLKARRDAMHSLGVSLNRIVLDPGIGFGKNMDQNVSLLQQQEALLALDQPLLVGWSRKGTLGKLTAVHGQIAPAAERAGASVAAALIAVQKGAAIVRVHDVRETVQALRFWKAPQA